MVYNIYSIRDKETGFMSPMVDMNDGAAARNFAKAVNSGEGLLGYAPKDFDLYRIGSFNNETAELVPAQPIKFVVNGAALIGDRDA